MEHALKESANVAGGGLGSLVRAKTATRSVSKMEIVQKMERVLARWAGMENCVVSVSLKKLFTNIYTPYFRTCSTCAYTSNCLIYCLIVN